MFVSQTVGEHDPRLGAGNEAEPGPAGLRNRKRAPAKTLALVPVGFPFRLPQRRIRRMQEAPRQKEDPDHLTTSTLPPESTVISRALAGTSPVVTLPPGQRTQIPVGCWGVASTCTALSCDQDRKSTRLNS